MLQAERGNFAAKILFLIMILPERLLRSEKKVRYEIPIRLLPGSRQQDFCSDERGE